MPDAAWAVSVLPQADPGRWVNPRFWHRLIRFRHFIDGSLALASLNRACRDHVPTFPQRSPPSLLTTAACGGLRSTPDSRPRRALLHLSYSCAWPFGPAMLVTQDPNRKWLFSPSSPSGQSITALRNVSRSGSFAPDRNLNAVEIRWPFRLGLQGRIVNRSQDLGWQRAFGHGRKIVPEVLQRRGADDDAIIAFGVEL